MTEEDQRLAILCAIGALAEKLTGEPLSVDVPAADGTHTIIVGRLPAAAVEGQIADPCPVDHPVD